MMFSPILFNLISFNKHFLFQRSAISTVLKHEGQVFSYLSSTKLIKRKLSLMYTISSTQDARDNNRENKKQPRNNTNPRNVRQEHVMDNKNKNKNDGSNDLENRN